MMAVYKLLIFHQSENDETGANIEMVEAITL